MEQTNYDCIIVGGGIAGLSLSILLAKQKRSILLIEKKKYPYHKVCGEYISMESYNFLRNLGVNLESMNLPFINELNLSSVDGIMIEQKLDLGGFGLSRYQLDHNLSKLATDEGVIILEDTNAFKYTKNKNVFTLETNKGNFTSTILCASIGRHSFGNFFKAKNELENWVGIKYHIKYQHNNQVIALHNFNGGYCGMSKIEDDKSCLCYLVKSSQLKKYNNDIQLLEQNELRKNPYLNTIFKDAKFLFDKPLTVSNVTFSNKKAVEDHVFYLGDAAGTIAPLSGNGMSMAVHAAKLLADNLKLYFERKVSLNDVETMYTKAWNKEFYQRIHTGKILQKLFCSPKLTGIFIHLVKLIKPLRIVIIKRTHGQSF